MVHATCFGEQGEGFGTFLQCKLVLIKKQREIMRYKESSERFLSSTIVIKTVPQCACGISLFKKLKKKGYQISIRK